MTSSNLKTRWGIIIAKRKLKKIRNELEFEHTFEQWREIMCGCYDEMSGEQIAEDLNRRIEGDEESQKADKEYQEAINE